MHKTQYSFCCFLIALQAQAAVIHGQELALPDVLAQAMQVNPKLQSLDLLVKARQAAVRQAGVGLNPEIGGSAGNRTQTLGIDQEIEYPGKRHARKLAAMAEVEVAQAEQQMAVLELQKEVAQLFYTVLWAEQNVVLLQQNVTVTEKFLQAAQFKFDQGFGSELDVVKGQVESVRAKRLLRQAQQEQLTARNKIKTLLKIPLVQAVNLRGDLLRSRLPITTGLDSLLSQALAAHPAVRLQNARLAVAQRNLEMVRLSARPNFNLGLEGGVEDHEALVTFNFRLPLNLWDRKEGAKAEAQLEQQSIASESENVAIHLTQQITTAFQAHQAAAETVQLFDNALLQKAKDAATAAQRAFESGSFRFLDLIDAQRTYLETMLEYYSSVLALRQAEIDLRIAAGQSLVR